MRERDNSRVTVATIEAELDDKQKRVDALEEQSSKVSHMHWKWVLVDDVSGLCIPDLDRSHCVARSDFWGRQEPHPENI